MTDPDEFARALSSLAAALTSLSVTWAVGGPLASAAYGEPRATNDIDVIALLDERTARELAKALEPNFYTDSDVAVAAARTRGSFNIIDNRSFIKIDVFVPATGPMGTGQLSRRRILESVGGVSAVPVLGPEDVVLQKLRWFDLGGGVSERQWRDILSVLRGVGDDLDHAYLDGVASQSGLQTLLNRARLGAAEAAAKGPP